MARKEGTGSTGAWPVVLAGVGVAACCGGPLLGGWLTSMGVAAAVGGWWSQGHGWVMGAAVAVGAAATVILGTALIRARRRAGTLPTVRRSREVR